MDFIFNFQIFNDLFFNYNEKYCTYKSIYLTLRRKHLYIYGTTVSAKCKEDMQGA